MSTRAAVGSMLAALAGAAACERPDVVQPPCDPPGAVVVAPATDTLAVGETARFHALVAGCKLATRALTWSIRDESVATVTSATDTPAVVTGKTPGQTVLIATAVADTALKAGALLIVIPGP